MKKTKLLLLGLIALSTSLSAADYTKDGNRITLTLPHSGETAAQTVRLTVVNDNIIRVEATPDAAIPQTSSLIIVKQTANPQYTVSEDDGTVIVKAKNVSAMIDKKSGRISFFDAYGMPYLKESDGSKTFKPYNVGGAKGYSWHLLFDSPDDEAFYGLGQHQSNELNMKGRNEELFQYNTKIAMPFVLSNKNYGLLWDSYSYCRFGNPNEYQQLGRIFTLYDKNGEKGHLTGTYIQKDGNERIRKEDSIYFENSRTVVNLPDNVSLNGASVKYEGSIEAPETATYYFILYYAGYTKVYIDGQLVVPERWRTAWNPNAYKFEVKLQKGEKVPLLIDWKPDGTVSYCGLRVATPQSDEMQNKLSVWSEMTPDMDYYFIAGKNMDDVISGYRTLTGKSTMMAKSVMGFWQSREKYNNQWEIVSTLKKLREHGMPIDNIVQDWFYWREDQWGSQEFDPARFPDPQAMLDSIHAMHGKYMISVWPKLYCNTDNYKTLDSHGWMYHQAVKDSIRDWVGRGHVGSFYDAYSPDARKMFWGMVDKGLYSKYHHGIDYWWMDASEPNVRDCTPIDYRKQLCGPTVLGPSDEYFNAYALVNADGIYNGQRSVTPDKRVFLLTRSGFAGLQRYGTGSWSGDIGTRWEDMRAQMTAGLNYCMSGIPFWGMDIGGFSVESRYAAAQQLFDKTGQENEDLKEWRELQARWHQFGAFVPLFRTHGQWPLREVYNLAPESHPAYKSILYYARLRYNLMPYLYSLDAWTNLKDYTIMRGLVMDFQHDSKVNDICDQWMFGPALMACPVGYYKTYSRDVYLPQTCGWYDFYNGTHYDGGQTINADAPYERMPLFVREGAIIPFGPDMQYSTEKPAELINLYVYAGQNGQFMLYEDENDNYNYEKGQYATINISYSDKTHQLTIGQRKGTFKGMLKNRRFNVVLVSKDKTQGYDGNTKGKLVRYNGKTLTVKL